MRILAFRFGIALTAAMIIIAVWADVSRSQPPPPFPDKAATAVAVKDTLEDHLQKARENVLKHDIKAAAAEIRQAAAALKLEAQQATTEEAKQALTASGNELEALASQVEAGTVTSAHAFDQAFARAHYAMANNYYLQAGEAVAKQKAVQAGHALAAAATHLEHGMAWAGTALEPGTVTVIKHARSLARQLIAGGSGVLDRFGQGSKAIGQEIEKFGKEVKAAKS